MTIEANGIKVNFELTGPAAAPVVMLSHSLATDLAMWEPQLPALTARYRVLRYDTRGHGGTDAPEAAYSLPQLAADARALLDELGIDKVHWVGISMGGMIGQQFALEHAQRLASLSLCDTTARIPPEALGQWDERIQVAREQGLEPLVEPTIERWFSPEYRRRESARVETVRDMIRATPPAGYIGCCEAIKHLDLLDRLAEVAAPTLILVGENDPGTPVAASETLREHIPGSQLEILPHAFHLSNIEAAEEFNEALLGFLDRNGG